MDEIERKKDEKEKYPWEKKRNSGIPEKYIWTNGKNYDMRVTFNN